MSATTVRIIFWAIFAFLFISFFISAILYIEFAPYLFSEEPPKWKKVLRPVFGSFAILCIILGIINLLCAKHEDYLFPNYHVDHIVEKLGLKPVETKCFQEYVEYRQTLWFSGYTYHVPDENDPQYIIEHEKIPNT